MKKGIIFDMDGTVWDSAQNVAKSWDIMVKEAGYTDKSITTQDIQSVMGKPMDEIANILFPFTAVGDERNAIRKACEEYELVYLAEHGGQVYPRVFETWAKLKEMGYHLYIVSNCQSGYIEAFLTYFGLTVGEETSLIEDIECYGNNLLQKDENISLIVKRNNLDAATYVGDIQGDYNSTVKAGLPFIHAAYGFGTINAEVARIETFSDLIKVVPTVI